MFHHHAWSIEENTALSKGSHLLRPELSGHSLVCLIAFSLLPDSTLTAHPPHLYHPAPLPPRLSTHSLPPLSPRIPLHLHLPHTRSRNLMHPLGETTLGPQRTSRASHALMPTDTSRNDAGSPIFTWDQSRHDLEMLEFSGRQGSHMLVGAGSASLA
jgi:hypothetical protein